MIASYSEAVTAALGGLLEVALRLSLPLAIVLATGIGAAIFATATRPAATRSADGAAGWPRADVAGRGRIIGVYLLIGLLAVVLWTGLRTIYPVERQAALWRERAEATANPAPDAPPVYQYGPVAAALAEQTYTRTLTLPPYLVERLGSDGIGVLAPYLSDPSAENVLRLVDTFRRSGRDVVFTRQVTRLAEQPIPFTRSQVRANFRRLTGRAYDLEFEGRYGFANTTRQPITVRFTFALPQAGTVRDLEVTVNTQAVTETNPSGLYEWTGTLAPGAETEAVVRYRVVGARTWHYDIGSQRRRVQQFQLEAISGGGPVRFPRGSLQPSGGSGNRLHWELANVVTSQQVGLSFPPDVTARAVYLQALGALPASFALFLVGILIIGWRFRSASGPGGLAAALTLFALGLGSAPILANYVGALAALLAGPLLGALLAARLLEARKLLPVALTLALLPATFLSSTHTGLLVMLLAAVAALALWWAPPRLPARADEAAVQ